MIARYNSFNRKIYFAHPKSTYGKEIENRCIGLINQFFPECEIINPADYQEDFLNYKKSNSDYMEFFRNLINSCDMIVFLPFVDGKVGYGIIYEIECIDPDEIYEINLKFDKINKVSKESVKSRGLDLEETGNRNKNIDSFI